jgi:hypothetical protein
MIPEVTTETMLRWAPNTPRTRIQDRQGNAHWRQPREKYIDGIVRELQLMKARSILITHSDNERLDPGVAVWFSMKKEEYDYSWQDGLGLDSPAPTLQEIDEAFRAMASKYHPDRPGGGDPDLFKRMGDYRREARAWVMGTHEQHELVVPCDHYNETRLNFAALRFAFQAFRSLERVGIPGILDRTLTRTFSALSSGA